MANGRIMPLGTGFFFAGTMDLPHILAYKGMSVLDAPKGANRPPVQTAAKAALAVKLQALPRGFLAYCT